MAEYIDREAFLDAKRKLYCADCARRKGMKNGKFKTLYEIGDAPCRACGVNDVLEDVEDFPAADVVEVKHGEWIGEADGYADGELVYDMWYCSNCDYCVDDDEKPWYHYCPNCGAKMDGDGDV